VWIVFGTRVNARRVPGGLKVERTCGECGENATFYEKEVKRTFNLYFVDVLDYGRHRVMACGCCGACYATDELDAPETRSAEEPAHPARAARALSVADRVGDYVDRAASALESGISTLFRDEPSGSAPPERDEAPPPMPSGSDGEVDPLDDPLEARFRELERKARIRID
jgi:hypothetical protein